MDVVMTKPPMADYPAIFRGYIHKSTEFALKNIEQAGLVLPRDLAEQALRILSFSLKLPETWSEVRELLVIMAPKMELAGYRDEWIPYLEEGIRQSVVQEDKITEAELHLQLGLLYQLRSKYDEAHHHHQISGTLFAHLGDIANQVRALNQLAYVARLQRNFDQAECLVETIQQLLPQKDDQWAFSRYVQGLVALDQRQWELAIKHAKEAYHIWEQDKNQRMMGRSLMCSSVALEKSDQFEEALEANQHALSLFEEIDDTVYQAIVKINIGNAFFAQENFNEALSYYWAAEKKCREVQDYFSLGMVTNNLAITYRSLEQWENAKAAYLRSIEYKKSLGNVPALINTIDGFGIMYLKKGSLLEAKHTFEEAWDWLEKIENELDYQYCKQMIMTNLEAVNKKLNKNNLDK